MELFRTSVGLLNQPLIKEGIKTLAGSVTFAFGMVEVYDIYRMACHRDNTTEFPSSVPKWMHIANKIIVACAKLSLILSAGVSRPGICLISALVGRVFPPSQLGQAFGPYTTFVVNPWHPRHLISIAAVILALPSFIQSTDPDTDNNIQVMTTFNTITSRPTLHLGNRLSRYLLTPLT